MILHFLPLCRTCYEAPECLYSKVGGQHTARVYAYNTLVSSTRRGEEPAFGPEDRWADLDHHHAKLLREKKDGRKLLPENWKVAMAWAQTVRHLSIYCIYIYLHIYISCVCVRVCVSLYLSLSLVVD